MDTEYIQKAVGPSIAQAISSLLEHNLHSTRHPQDGIEFIGEYLMFQSQVQQRINQHSSKQDKIDHLKQKIIAEKNEIIAKMSIVLTGLMEKVQELEQRREQQREFEEMEKNKQQQILEQPENKDDEVEQQVPENTEQEKSEDDANVIQEEDEQEQDGAKEDA